MIQPTRRVRQIFFRWSELRLASWNGRARDQVKRLLRWDLSRQQPEAIVEAGKRLQAERNRRELVAGG